MRNNEERLGANTSRQDVAVPQQLIQPQPQNQQQSLNFIVPTEYIMLPSAGRFYPAHHPLCGKDSIEIKQMTAKEEDILSSRNLLKKGVALDKLIESLVVDKNINTDTLTIEDRNAIVINARISAYGADYATTVTCPECSTKAKFTFNLLEKVEREDVPSLSADDQVSVNEDGTFNVVLPASKWKIKCRALNGYDEKILLKTSEMKKTSNTNDSLFLEQIKLMVLELQSVSVQDNKLLVHTGLETLPAKDSKYLRNVYEKIVKPYDMTKSFNCSNCDYSSTLEVPLTADFFWFK